MCFISVIWPMPLIKCSERKMPLPLPLPPSPVDRARRGRTPVIFGCEPEPVRTRVRTSSSSGARCPASLPVSKTEPAPPPPPYRRVVPRIAPSASCFPLAVSLQFDCDADDSDFVIDSRDHRRAVPPSPAPCERRRGTLSAAQRLSRTRTDGDICSNLCSSRSSAPKLTSSRSTSLPRALTVAPQPPPPPPPPAPARCRNSRPLSYPAAMATSAGSRCSLAASSVSSVNHLNGGYGGFGSLSSRSSVNSLRSSSDDDDHFSGRHYYHHRQQRLQLPLVPAPAPSPSSTPSPSLRSFDLARAHHDVRALERKLELFVDILMSQDRFVQVSYRHFFEYTCKVSTRGIWKSRR